MYGYSINLKNTADCIYFKHGLIYVRILRKPVSAMSLDAHVSRELTVIRTAHFKGCANKIKNLNCGDTSSIQISYL